MITPTKATAAMGAAHRPIRAGRIFGIVSANTTALVVAAVKANARNLQILIGEAPNHGGCTKTRKRNV
jgi:hypothetical protein